MTTAPIPVWPHSPLQEIFPHVLFVMGTNKTTYNGVPLQHSRNMVIIQDNQDLTLINTVRLDEAGLKDLDNRGTVKHIVRLGAFHGRDDGFYLDRYKDAQFWALPQMNHDHGHTPVQELIPNGPMPFSSGSFLPFETSIFPEGVIHLDREGGILITCDSIKNWTIIDPYFSPETGLMYQQQGLLGQASLSDIWLQACQVQKSDFLRLMNLRFRHLLSAHGEPLLNTAHELIGQSIEDKFKS
jgi:hypothetical protein